MNTKQQGDIGVAVAIAYYTLQGYAVSAPFTDNARYDLLVEKAGSVLRVQCKTSRYQTPSGSYEVALRTSGGNRSWKGTRKLLSKSEIDLLFIFTFDGTCYEFEADFFDNKAVLILSSNKASHKVWEFPLPHGLAFAKDSPTL